MPISNDLIDQLLQDCHSPQDLLGESGLLKELTKRLAERVLEAGGCKIICVNGIFSKTFKGLQNAYQQRSY
ncbi:hypothetical protein SODG_005024 [Sodalis praecaptivus]